MKPVLGPRPVSSFYGEGPSLRAKNLAEKAAKVKKSVEPYAPRGLLDGPNLFWKVFRKQDDALEFSKFCSGGLMTFAFEPQDNSVSRLFLSAHPKVFWHYDSQRSPNERCSYEVITESAVCKMYADLEFTIQYNPDANGPRMVEIFVDALLRYLKNTLNFDGNLSKVLDLDSSTETKFSRHLIVENACFADNYHVGHVMKRLCSEIFSSITANQLSHSLNGIDLQDLKKLVVLDSKGNQTIFCDLCVYTKNRHFRVFRSTKKGKNSPLVVNESCPFSKLSDIDIFLASLVTYVCSECKVLEVKDDIKLAKCGDSTLLAHAKDSFRTNPKVTPSPHPAVDDFILKTVHPGIINKSFYFASSNIVVYNIVGNRFCGNINREHKSNNVKYVVDLDKYEYYQKCHDYDCSGYRSPAQPLPTELVFQIADISDLTPSGTPGMFGLAVEDAHALLDLDIVKTVGVAEFSEKVSNASGASAEVNLPKFPSFGLGDDAFNNIGY